MAAEGSNEQQMTVAELCQAIAEGRLPYTMRDGHYEVRAADARRLRSQSRFRLALPDPVEIPAELLDAPDLGQLHFSV